MLVYICQVTFTNLVGVPAKCFPCLRCCTSVSFPDVKQYVNKKFTSVQSIVVVQTIVKLCVQVSCPPVNIVHISPVLCCSLIERPTISVTCQLPICKCYNQDTIQCLWFTSIYGNEYDLSCITCTICIPCSVGEESLPEGSSP